MRSTASRRFGKPIIFDFQPGRFRQQGSLLSYHACRGHGLAWRGFMAALRAKRLVSLRDFSLDWPRLGRCHAVAEASAVRLRGADVKSPGRDFTVDTAAAYRAVGVEAARGIKACCG